MNHLQVLFKRTHRRLSRPAVIMLALVALALGGVAATGDRALAQTSEPCDIYGANGTSCVAAYSTTRAMYASYDGPLYQVQRASDGATANIGLLTAGGDVNAAEQDSFCAASNCTITEIFDQSPEGNNLTVEGPGTAGRQADVAANAKALPMTIGGHEAYGVDIEPGTGYRDDAAHGTATKGQPEGMYMIASGTHTNSGCCFDFGNVETGNSDDGAGTMDALNLSTMCGAFTPCAGPGPWVGADLENGIFLANGQNTSNTGNDTPFVTAMLQNNGQNTFALEGGNSASGGLTTWYDGPLPSGYSPMNQEGAIVLGTGGDNSNSDNGSWFEGVMTAGFPNQAANAAVQANIVAAGYGGDSDPVSAVASAAGQAVAHSGYSSVYTVDSSNGDLQETYLPALGQAWHTQNLSTIYGTPPVMAGTEPVALVHCGWTSVYTVDAGSGDLQETYLPALGDGWTTQNLTVNYGTPPTNVTPNAVFHTAGAPNAGCSGYASVYTVDSSNGHLQETFLPNVGFPGDQWQTQDMTAKFGTPAALAGTSPVALVHCGWTSVYTADAGSGDLQETYLPALGDGWTTQNLSANFGTPPTSVTPSAVFHTSGSDNNSSCPGYTSVYTVDSGSNDLQETYLPNFGFPGEAWHTQNFATQFGTPPVAAGTQPEALVHMNYTSVYTVDSGSGDLQETYLPITGGPWSTQNLSATYGTPATGQSPTVLLHPDAAGSFDWASVYTVDSGSGHLQETYLSNVGFPRDAWVTQDMSAKFGVPSST
jgi:hypothetical protein